jgi:hypothetical protein
MSSAQIDQVQNFDELASLRSTLLSGLAGKSEAEYPEDFAKLAQLEDKIVSLKQASLKKEFADKAKDGLVPLPVLNPLELELGAKPQASASKWAAVLQLVQAEKSKTNAKIAELATKAAGESNPSEKVGIYDRLAALSGKDEWKAKRDDIINLLVTDIRKALQDESLDPALREKLAVIKSLRRGDATLLDEMIGVDAKIYEKQFFDALAEGKADDAYKVLVSMSEANDFAMIKDKLAPTSQKMGDLFTALANDSVKDPGNLAQSF